ncbi:MAG: alpha/beta hydrolase [Halioglobus sp.]
MPGQPGYRNAVPQQWQVNGLQLAGLSWGEPGQKPLLALHGWFDNAASFVCLAPLLAGYHVVAPDLTGHGRSARRSADASYQIWDDLPEILGVLQALGWTTFDLMGHSRGGIIATLLAAAYPERVGKLVLLDAVSPEAVPEENFPGQLRSALQDKQRLLDRPNRVFSRIEEAITPRTGRGLPPGIARVLVERNLRACPGGFTWTTDPRLQGASAVKMTEGQSRAVLRSLAMPTLLLLSGDESHRPPRLAEYARSCIGNLRVEHVNGGHHFHMEQGAPEIAQCVTQFLSTVESREFADAP